MRRVNRPTMILMASVVAVAAWLPSGLALAASGQTSLAATQARPPSAKTVVTFAWGGGLADQMPSLPMLGKYGMHATFFVPSGLVCMLGQAQCRKSSPYLTIADLRKIAAHGDEIGGLSVTHQNLATMPAAEAKREICDDRSNLFRLGFRPTDFAYPFALVTPATEALTRACGYNAGLGTGTIKGAGRCNTCAVAETIPPKNPFNIRTPVEVNSVRTTWIPRTYESIVADAQRHGGGWIIFTLHDICKTNCSLGTTPAILGAVLKWLHGQESHNTVVETMGQVIGGPLRPAVAGPAPRALPPPGVVNANLAQASGSIPACFQKVTGGGTVASFTYQPSGGNSDRDLPPHLAGKLGLLDLEPSLPGLHLLAAGCMDHSCGTARHDRAKFRPDRRRRHDIHVRLQPQAGEKLQSADIARRAAVRDSSRRPHRPWSLPVRQVHQGRGG